MLDDWARCIDRVFNQPIDHETYWWNYGPYVNWIKTKNVDWSEYIVSSVAKNARGIGLPERDVLVLTGLVLCRVVIRHNPQMVHYFYAALVNGETELVQSIIETAAQRCIHSSWKDIISRAGKQLPQLQSISCN